MEICFRRQILSMEKKIRVEVSVEVSLWDNPYSKSAWRESESKLNSVRVFRGLISTDLLEEELLLEQVLSCSKGCQSSIRKIQNQDSAYILVNSTLLLSLKPIIQYFLQKMRQITSKLTLYLEMRLQPESTEIVYQFLSPLSKT